MCLHFMKTIEEQPEKRDYADYSNVLTDFPPSLNTQHKKQAPLCGSEGSMGDTEQKRGRAPSAPLRLVPANYLPP